MEPRIPVTFVPSRTTCWVEHGVTVLEAARAADVTIPAPCGGRGLCGACGVRVVEGRLGAPDDAERVGLKRAPDGVRLSCRATIIEPVVLRPVVAYRSSAIPIEQSEGDLAVAVDIGTTNIAVAIVDVESGREVGRAGAPNRQSSWGADILSRIAASTSARDALTKAVRDSVSQAVDSTGVDWSRVVRVVVAGNTVMSGLFAGVDVTSLGAHPFAAPDVPETLDAAAVLGRQLPPGAVIHIVPALAGFVGGDVAAGLVGLGLASTKSTSLLIDVGTNAEIALVDGEDVYVASAAAGPAFDGVGISSGGPVAEGAIVRVRVERDEAQIDVKGSGEPRWFGGSGTVSMVAALLRAGHLANDGLMSAQGPLARHFSTDEHGVLRVCPVNGKPELCFSQLDVRAIQLAKAAVRTGVEMVLEAAGVDAGELDAVLVAGAFGGALDAKDLVSIGMVGSKMEPALSVAGNTSLRGAVAMALDIGLMDEARRLPRRCRRVDLASGADFEARLIQALNLVAVD